MTYLQNGEIIGSNYITYAWNMGYYRIILASGNLIKMKKNIITFDIFIYDLSGITQSRYIFMSIIEFQVLRLAIAPVVKKVKQDLCCPQAMSIRSTT